MNHELRLLKCGRVCVYLVLCVPLSVAYVYASMCMSFVSFQRFMLVFLCVDRLDCPFCVCRGASESQRPIELNGLLHTYQPEATGYRLLLNLMWFPYASPVTWQGPFLIIFSLFNIGVKTRSLNVCGHGWNSFLSCRAFYILLPWLLKWILKHFDVNVKLVVFKWNNMQRTCWYVFHSLIPDGVGQVTQKR